MGMTHGRSWDQQPQEGPTSYEHFQTYLNLETRPRRNADVAKHHNLSVRTINNECAKHKWISRATDYDNWVRSHTDIDTATAIATQQAEVHRLAVSTVKSAIQVAGQIINNIDLNDMSKSEENILKTVLNSLSRYAMPTEADTAPEITVSWSPHDRGKLLKELSDEAQRRAEQHT